MNIPSLTILLAFAATVVVSAQQQPPPYSIGIFKPPPSYPPSPEPSLPPPSLPPLPQPPSFSPPPPALPNSETTTCVQDFSDVTLISQSSDVVVLSVSDWCSFVGTVPTFLVGKPADAMLTKDSTGNITQLSIFIDTIGTAVLSDSKFGPMLTVNLSNGTSFTNSLVLLLSKLVLTSGKRKLLQQTFPSAAQNISTFSNLCGKYNLPNNILSTKSCPNIPKYIAEYVTTPIGYDLLYSLIFGYICAINSGCAYVESQVLSLPPPPSSPSPPKSNNVPPAVVYPTDLDPVWVISADFNGDGHIDLATANTESTVSILLNNGDGTFAPTANYPTGIQPVLITFADFNGDDKVDLATVQNSDNSISILLGYGDGTFAPPVNYPAGSDPDWVNAADFNGDGHVDLVTANAGDTTVSIVFNKGDGTFAFPISYPTDYNPTAMTVADFNGDGRIDVATASYSASNVSILLNDNDITFFPHIDLPTGIYLGNEIFIGYQPAYMNTADFNGDGKIDIATAGNDGTVSILLGYGYGIARIYPVGSANPSAMAVADFNNDGHIDVATLRVNFFDTTVSIVFGRGDGTFSIPKAKNYLTFDVGGIEPLSVTVADFNGDGNIDLAIAFDDGSDQNLGILFGYGNGTFSDT